MNIPTRAPAPSRALAKRLSGLHRLAGITVLLPVLVLIVTGIPLQFTEALRLGTSEVHSSWLHARYGIAAPDTALVSGDVTQLGELLVIGKREIDGGQSSGDLLGAVAHDVATIVMLQNTILLIPHDVSIQVEMTSLPQPVARFGVTPSNDLMVDAAQGGTYVSYDLGASWTPAALMEVAWQTVSKIEADAAMQARYRAKRLSWERVLLDMHSGRIAGATGEWVMNAASFVMMVLALTGFAMWLLPRPGQT